MSYQYYSKHRPYGPKYWADCDLTWQDWQDAGHAEETNQPLAVTFGELLCDKRAEEKPCTE